MVRGSQHDKSAVPEIRGEFLIGCAVAPPPALRADMRRSNPHDSLPGRSRPSEILLHQVPQRSSFFRICGPRMGCLANRTFRKSQQAVPLEIAVNLVFKKAGPAEGLYQMFGRFADFRASQRAGKLGLQIILCSRPIE